MPTPAPLAHLLTCPVAECFASGRDIVRWFLSEVVRLWPSFSAQVVWDDGYTQRVDGATSPTGNMRDSVCAPVIGTGQVSGILWVQPVHSDPNNAAIVQQVARRLAVLAEYTPATHSVESSESLSQRYAEAARVLASVGHDLNNDLTTLTGYAELAAYNIHPTSPAAPHVYRLVKLVRESQRIPNSMFEFSRSSIQSAGSCQIETVVDSVRQQLPQLTVSRVRLVMHNTPACPEVAINALALEQLLMPLILNAVEASSENCSIYLTTRLVELSSDDCPDWRGACRPGRHVEVSVRDTGAGIDLDVRSKLLVQLFYSTKPRRRGLGLGCVFRILCAHSGGLIIDPATNLGTQIRFVLPVGS